MSDVAQLEQISAYLGISNLISRYAQVVRYDCPEQVADLYTLDGVFEVRRGAPDKAEHTVRSRDDGREAIRASMAAIKGLPHPVPLIHNLLVEADGDRAIATCVMEGRLSSTGESQFWGEYNDTCARLDGCWFFASRIFTIYEAGSTI